MTAIGLLLATLNIKGVGVGSRGSTKKVYIWRLFSRMSNQLQVIALQKHWMDEDKCKKKVRSFPYTNGYKTWNSTIQGSGGK